MSLERRRVYYSGWVQGVGFRYTSHRVAQRFAVAGSVRNLGDGRVELIAEGEPTELDSFLEAIRRELGDKIRDVRVETDAVGSPPLSGFQIRH